MLKKISKILKIARSLIVHKYCRQIIDQIITDKNKRILSLPKIGRGI